MASHLTLLDPWFKVHNPFGCCSHAFWGFCFCFWWDRPPSASSFFHLSVKGLWTPLSCQSMVGKTSYPLQQALVEPFYYLTEWWLTHPTTTMKQDHNRIIVCFTTFQPFLLSKFLLEICVSLLLYMERISFPSLQLWPNIQIWRIWNPKEKES
jgi:hypothetical protein